MSLTTNENRITTEELRELLAGRRLPKWAPWAPAGGAIGISLLLLAVGVLGGVAQAAVSAGVLFLVGQAVWSFRIEGRRHATDRFATTLIYSAFVVAIVPLVAILFSVIQRALKYCGPSSSPKRCATSAPVALAEESFMP